MQPLWHGHEHNSQRTPISAEAELYALTTGVTERDGDDTYLERTWIWRDSREPCRQSICESMGIQTRVRTNETCIAEVRLRARCRGEEANDSCQCQYEVEKSRLDGKVPYFWNTHERMRHAGWHSAKTTENSPETIWNDVRSGKRCPYTKGECGGSRTFQQKRFKVMDLTNRDLAVSDPNQLTRWADKGNLTV